MLTTRDSDSESSSDSDSPHSAFSAASTTSTGVLSPRLPIIYNEAVLNQLHRRPQVRTLHNMSIPLPMSDEESPSSSYSDQQELPAEAEANSPTELSPVSKPEDGVPHNPMEESPTKPLLASPCRPGEESPATVTLDCQWRSQQWCKYRRVP